MSQIKTDTSTDVTYKEHCLSYSALRQIVHQKTCEFVGKFCIRPQYIKLPCVHCHNSLCPIYDEDCPYFKEWQNRMANKSKKGYTGK